jgi:hypothetical protein
MSNYEEELTELVEELIRTRREDDWWDFKQCHYEDKAELLHDILCLANNRANRDSYLILGIQDKTFEIIGVENNPNRKNQQNIVDFLKTPNFAGQVRPRVEVRTFWLSGHEIDVFIVKNSTDVPYYLVENYTDKKFKPEPPKKKGKTVPAFHIFTRVMDNNTPIDKNADIRDIEYLWKKRFGLLQTPLEQIKILLSKPDEWVEEDYRYYHKLFPQYTIVVEYEENNHSPRGEANRAFYHFLQFNTSTQYGMLKIFHYNTQLFSYPITALDEHKMTAPCPEKEVISFNSFKDHGIGLRYYVTSEFPYLLLRFLEHHMGDANGGDAQIATRKLLRVVLLFDDRDEIDTFSSYVLCHLDDFKKRAEKQLIPHIDNETKLAEKVLAQEIRDAKALKEMYQEWK